MHTIQLRSQASVLELTDNRLAQCSLVMITINFRNVCTFSFNCYSISLLITSSSGNTRSKAVTRITTPLINLHSFIVCLNVLVPVLCL